MFSLIRDVASGVSGRSRFIVPWNSSSTSFATSVSPGERNAPDTPCAPPKVVGGAQRSVVADGNEVFEGLGADVGSSFEYLFGGRPALVADFAGSEDVTAAPASFDVFDAVEQSGVFTALRIDSIHLCGVGGDVTAATSLRMAEHGEECTDNVDDLLAPLGCSLLQARYVSLFGSQADHTGEGRHLAEPGWIEVFECVEVDDHAVLALGDLGRQKTVPVARSGRPLHVFRAHAASLEVCEIALGITVCDHVLGDTAIDKMPGHRFDLYGTHGRPPVKNLTIG